MWTRHRRRQAVLRGMRSQTINVPPPVIRALKVEHLTLNPTTPNEFRVELPDDPATSTFSGGGGALRGQRKAVDKPATNRGRKKKGEKKRRKKRKRAERRRRRY